MTGWINMNAKLIIKIKYLILSILLNIKWKLHKKQF